MRTFKIAVLPGDGIGPEVMGEAIKVLKKIEKVFNIKFQLEESKIGGSAIDEFDTPLPGTTLNTVFKADAVLLGSIGGPKWDNLSPEKRPEIGGLLKLRKKMGLFANIRPVFIHENLKDFSPVSSVIRNQKINMITVRELSSGIYFGDPKELTDIYGLDTMIYKYEEVRRIADVAFQIAQKRSKKVTSIDKANVLYSAMLWRRVVEKTAESYPDVELNHLYIDNAAMQMVLDPSQFDVLLSTNMFGDIISDESAAISGSLGMLPSASLGGTVNLYEPAGGSAPDLAGKSLANPIAQILSAAMMLEHSFNEINISRTIFKAVEKTIDAGIKTRDISKNGETFVSTSEMGDEIVSRIIPEKD